MAKITVFKALGMKEEELAILKLMPALDLVMGSPSDVPHGDVQGMGRLAQDLLIVYILNGTAAQKQYANMLSKIICFSPAGLF